MTGEILRKWPVIHSLAVLVAEVIGTLRRHPMEPPNHTCHLALVHYQLTQLQLMTTAPS